MSELGLSGDPAGTGGGRGQQDPASSSGSGRGRVQAVLRRLGLGRAGGQVGLGIVALGLLVIGLGWNGAAGSGGEIDHVPVVQAQLPWLLSGGFLGLGIVVLGAALIVANAHREAAGRLEARLEVLAEQLERTSGSVADLGGSGVGPGSLAAVVAGTSGLGAPGVTAASEPLVVAGSASYHLPQCRLVRGRAEARLVPLRAAAAEGLSPCRVCRPPVVLADAG
jgi:hypothetical protein